MIVLPAIDLRGGRCVRLFQGDYAKETVYGDDPPAMAARFEEAGAEWLHVVDLDGAKSGRPEQLDVVRAIRERVGLRIELGGGVRTLDDARAAFEAGIERLILGTAALEAPKLLEEACRAWPGRIYVALDARDGKVATRGWTESTGIEVAEAARACAARGAAGFLFTDIARDGTGHGVNVEATAALAEAAGVPVLASGGGSSLDAVRQVREVESRGVTGVIVGRALYTGAVDLREALAVARGGG